MRELTEARWIKLGNDGTIEKRAWERRRKAGENKTNVLNAAEVPSRLVKMRIRQRIE